VEGHGKGEGGLLRAGANDKGIINELGGFSPGALRKNWRRGKGEERTEENEGRAVCVIVLERMLRDLGGALELPYAKRVRQK